MKDAGYDQLLEELSDYAVTTNFASDEAIDTARLSLLDSLGCALLALQYPACTKLLGPIVPGAVFPGGARVPGTNYELEPVRAAYNIGAMIRWLDFNDTWLAAEWGHPSDNLGGLIAVTDYESRRRRSEGASPFSVQDLLLALIQTHEIQGLLALENSFNRAGLDHVILVRIASTAILTRLLGGSRQEVIDALSQAWIDGGALRVYRQAPNTGSRKSWAAGDATARGVFHAYQTLRGEPGYRTPLTAQTWGFQEVLFGAQTIRLSRSPGSYVMENVLFKISYPAEFHAQTAVEAAIRLHLEAMYHYEKIVKIVIETQESGKRIIDKTGPLRNPADRDHCLQYMVAVALLKGKLDATDYEDLAATDQRIDLLRSKMEVHENPQFTADYLDPDKRAITNALQVFFENGSATERVEIAYPLGHPRRRKEGENNLKSKFAQNVLSRFAEKQANVLFELVDDVPRFLTTPVDHLMNHLVL